MLKVIMLRKKLENLQKEENQLRTVQAGFAQREEDLAAKVEAANTDAELAAVDEEVRALDNEKKTTKERLQAIADECAALLQEIEDAEEAAASAASDSGGDEGEERSRRCKTADFVKRCQEFQRTGRMTYRNALSMVRRTALLSGGTVGPTGVGGINDAQGIAVSDFIDLIKVTDCTGMSAYKVAYMTGDPTGAAITEGQVPTESEPTFGSVTLSPATKGLIAYISREIRKQTPLQYEQKVNESTTRALRRILSKTAVDSVVASTLNTTLALTGTSGAALFTPHLLTDIILAYGGDEGVDGAAVLVLNKEDLKAFAAVRGTNEYLPVYSIVPDSANPSSGVIKDNNGLSCRYCLSKDVTALSTLSLSSSAKKTMFYGNPQCCEMAMWGGVEVDVNDGYKFGEGLLTIRAEVTAASDVTVHNGFVVVTGKNGG